MIILSNYRTIGNCETACNLRDVVSFGIERKQNLQKLCFNVWRNHK